MLIVPKRLFHRRLEQLWTCPDCSDENLFIFFKVTYRKASWGKVVAYCVYMCVVTALLSKSEKAIQPQAPPPANFMKVYADPDHGNDLQERFSTLWRKGKFFDASLGVTNKKLHVSSSFFFIFIFQGREFVVVVVVVKS